jgi:hypothetical protein
MPTLLILMICAAMALAFWSAARAAAERAEAMGRDACPARHSRECPFGTGFAAARLSAGSPPALPAMAR